MKLQDLSSENRFLISCLRRAFDKDSESIDALLSRGLNWESILKKVTIHRIGPILSYAIKKASSDCYIPQSFKNILDRAYETTLARNTFIYHISDKLIKGFKDREIPLLIMRGPALGKSLYPDIALRPMSDIDILIKKEDYPKAHEMLYQLGYRTFIPSYTSQVIYVNKDSQMPLEIELHWDLDSKLEEDINQIWNNTRTIKTNANDMLMPRPEELLGHLLGHLNKHIRRGEAKLIWFCDIYLLIKRYGEDMDWNYFWNKVEGNSLGKPLYEILSLIKEWFEAPFAADRLKTVKDSYSEEEIFNPDTRGKIIYTSPLSKVRGFSNKIRYILRMLFPDKKFMARFYSKDQKSFSYLFYFYRLRRAFAIIFNTIFRKFKRGLKH